MSCICIYNIWMTTLFSNKVYLKLTWMFSGNCRNSGNCEIGEFSSNMLIKYSSWKQESVAGCESWLPAHCRPLFPPHLRFVNAGAECRLSGMIAGTLVKMRNAKMKCNEDFRARALCRVQRSAGSSLFVFLSNRFKINQYQRRCFETFQYTRRCTIFHFFCESSFRSS